MGYDFPSVVRAVGSAVAQGADAMGKANAAAAARANGVSAGAQAAQGAFNQNSVNIANTLGSDRLSAQYDFNSAAARYANSFTENMWQRAADWNEDMFGRSMEFNAEEAQKNRDWQEMMRNTAYQAAVQDMEKAGLNPILAVTSGGIQTGSGSGATASIGVPSMSGASGAMASGGLLNGLSASEGNYSGQMEYMGGLLGLLSAGLNGLSTAYKVAGSDNTLRIVMENVADGMSNLQKNANDLKNFAKNNPAQQVKEAVKDYYKNGKENQKHSEYIPNYRNGIDWNMKQYGDEYWNRKDR